MQVRGYNNLRGGIEPTAGVLILGAGIVGLLWGLTFHSRGHRNLIISEPLEARRNIAKKMRIFKHVISPDDLGSGDEASDFQSLAAVIDCSGNCKAIEPAFRLLGKGGQLVVFGLCPAEDTISVSPYDILMKELWISAGLLAPATFPMAISLVDVLSSDGCLDYANLGIKAYTIEEYEEAFKDLKEGTISKAVFKFYTPEE